MNEQQPSNTNGKPIQKMSDPPKVPFTKNTERMMMLICIAFMAAILIWKAPAISKIYDSADVIKSIYAYNPLQETLARHPGYVCTYFETQNGGNKSIDLYTCKLPEASVNQDTPIIYVYTENNKIIDHIIETNDQKYRLILNQADK